MRLQDLGTSPEKLLIILKSLNPSKAAGIDIFLSCKIAKIKPLLKKGSETDLQKYRLISLLPLLPKYNEGGVHDQTEKLLSKNELICRFQWGFPKTTLKIFVLGISLTKLLTDLKKSFKLE